MGIALPHNAQLTVKLAFHIFTIFPYHEVSIRHYIYCAYYEGKKNHHHPAEYLVVKESLQRLKNKQIKKTAAKLMK